MTDHPRSPFIPRILRGVALSGLALAGIVAVSGVILWDADFYVVRDRYEHLKLALFGDWQAENWCPPGRESANCAAVDDFEAALKYATDFTFFKSVPIDGSDLTVQTSTRFANARDVVAGKPSRQWCYFSIPLGGVSQQIELATQSADVPPIFAALASLDASAVAATGLSAETLASLAQSHCRFD